MNKFLNSKNSLKPSQVECLSAIHEELCWESETNFFERISLLSEYLQGKSQEDWRLLCKDCCQKELADISIEDILKSKAVVLTPPDVAPSIFSSYESYLEEMKDHLFEELEQRVEDESDILHGRHTEKELEAIKEILK